MGGGRGGGEDCGWRCWSLGFGDCGFGWGCFGVLRCCIELFLDFSD